MIKKHLLCFCTLLLGFFPAIHALADSTTWKQCMQAGNEVCGCRSARNVSTSLNNLAFICEQHATVAITLYNRAGNYARIGKYAEAKLLFKRALAIDEKAFGPNHADVARDLAGLGLILLLQGQKYAEAELLFKRALAIDEKVLGANHEEVANVLSWLGDLYLDETKYKLAEPLYKRALAIYEKVDGPHSPPTIQCLEMYAVVLRNTDRTKEAIELESRAQ